MASEPIDGGSISGKRILVFEGGTEGACLRNLRQYMSRFPTREMLAYIGRLSNLAERSPRGVLELHATSVPYYCLPYLALLSIEYSNDHRGHPPDDAAFEKAVRLFLGLPTPLEKASEGESDGDAIAEFLVRLGQQQFEYAAETRHLLPRTLLLYGEAWSSAERASSIDLDKVIRSLTGNNLVTNIVFGLTFSGAAKDGFFRAYRQSASQRAIPRLFEPEAQARFLSWVSSSYHRIRQVGNTQVVLNDTYDPYRFNPLASNPVVCPDLQPTPDDPVYLLPVRRLLVEKVTRGVYHDLSRCHDQGEGINPFRVAFGYAFQEYVGLLLREAFGNERVLRERKYSSRDGERDSPDWIVLDGENATAVEVKQSGLTLDSKRWGDLRCVRRDLRDNLAKAARQLEAFERAVRNEARGLEPLNRIKVFERIVVTWDQVFWGNSLICTEIAEVLRTDGKEVPTRLPHVAAVNEFEYLLGYCWRGSLFDLLKRKREGADRQVEMDFKDWMGTYLLGKGIAHANPFLSNRFHEFLQSWGLPSPADQ